MRGKGLASNPRFPSRRITPAHAGKRRRQENYNVGFEDHPRPCGEKPIDLLFARREPGSPPPMRGKALVQLRHYAHAGITPAHAGKRLSRLLSSRRS